MPGENFPGDRIVSLIDELEGLIEEAKPPFGKNAQFKVIDADVFFNTLDEIRMSDPEEWQKSRRILKEREELMASAAAQADSIIADAQQQALTIAGEQEIVRLAQQQADDIRDRAQQYERETRYAAEDYADERDRVTAGYELGERILKRRAAKDSRVKRLQKRLACLGYDAGEPDGVFGAQTEAAVRGFQKISGAQFGLKVDGIVGNQTKEALTYPRKWLL